jgi:hypothetical protein
VSAVRLLDPASRPPATPIEWRLVHTLTARGPLSRSVLVSAVARGLYRDELAESGWLTALGFFGVSAFVREVARTLDAGCGVLWELEPGPHARRFDAGDRVA